MPEKRVFPTIRDFPDSPLRRVTDGILNLIYPDSCFVCRSPVSRSRDCSVCFRCWNRILDLRISPPWCPSCGLPFFQSGTEPEHLCGDCNLELPPYGGARAYGYYTSELSRLVQGLKFEGRKNLVELLTPLLANAFITTWDPAEIDHVMPVPLHPKRKRERGYNQAALLGRAFSKRLGLPFHEDALRRIRHTAPQVGLSDSERRQNLTGAFRCGKTDAVARQRILLIDDVMTTGATVAAASQALIEAGALRVSVLTVARAVVGVE